MIKEEMQQYLTDLEVTKKDLAKQVDAILYTNQISSRGKNRVIQSIVNFPDVPNKITDKDEAALVTVLYQAKNIQIAMLTIQKAIEQADAQKQDGEV